MEATPVGTIITGYKYTNQDMQCRGYQFVLGEWHEAEGEPKLCENGFHFCAYTTGPFTYAMQFFDLADVRLFRVEAEVVVGHTNPLETAGTDGKMVAKRIRLVEEITGQFKGKDWNVGYCNSGRFNVGTRNTGEGNVGDWNSGDWNDGTRNTGYSNTGHRNAGHGNRGDYNTSDNNVGSHNAGRGNVGDWNSGNGNTGSRNVGSENHGDYNTGCMNEGDLNSGSQNKGNANSGSYNVGHRNAGDGNIGHQNAGENNIGDCNVGVCNVGDNRHGMFCVKEQPLLFFDEPVPEGARYDEWIADALARFLRNGAMDLMQTPEETAESIRERLMPRFLTLPNATIEKIEWLEREFKQAREAVGEEVD